MKKIILSILFLVFTSVVYSEDNFQIIVKDSKGTSREDAFVIATRMADDFLLFGDGFSEKCKKGGKFSKEISVDKTSGKETYYEVYAVIPDYGVSKRHKVKISTTSTTPITLTVQKSGSIFGKLTLPNDKPAKESYIVICEEDGTKVDEVDPDTNDNYQYKEIPPGKYKFYIIHDPEETSNSIYPTKVIPVAIKEGEPKKQDVNFTAEATSLSGKFSGFGELTIITLFKEGEYINPMSRPYLKQCTNKIEGTYNFQNIEPGNYELCVIAVDEPNENDLQNKYMNPSMVLLYHKKVNILSGENKRDIVIPNQKRTEVEGYVVDTDNKRSVPEAVVELLSPEGTVIARNKADLNGHYLIKKIPFGKYQVKITRQVRQLFYYNTPVLRDYEKSKTFNKDFVIINNSEKQNLNFTLP